MRFARRLFKVAIRGAKSVANFVKDRWRKWTLRTALAFIVLLVEEGVRVNLVDPLIAEMEATGCVPHHHPVVFAVVALGLFIIAVQRRH